MKRLRQHSISVRLIGLFLLTALLLVVVVRTGFHFTFKNDLRDLTRPHIAEYVQHLIDRIGDPPDIERAKALSTRLPVDIHIRGPQQRWSSTGKPPMRIARPERWHRHRLPNGRVVHVVKAGNEFRLRTRMGDHHLILIPHGMQSGEWTPLFGIGTILAVLAVIALTYHLIRRLFRPVQEIRTGINRIGAGDLKHRIQINRKDELGELASNINTMANDIEQMLEAKRQLLLAISHELRSPLTRAKVNLELLTPSCSTKALEHDLREMETLLNELLETERLNSRHASLNLTASDPAKLIQEVITEHFPENKIQTELQQPDTFISLDPVRIKLLVKNLLENALRHTPTEATPPKISSRLEESHWLLEVHDHGHGIPAEHLPHITEPFYRADASRHRETGGYGLGLYLCRVIAEAHGGNLKVESHVGEGTQIKIAVPLEQP